MTPEFRTWRGKSGENQVYVIQSGVGSDRALFAARAIASLTRFDFFISTGCAGALVSGLGSGDLIVAKEVVAGGSVWAVSGWLASSLLLSSREARVPVKEGRILTSPKILDTTEKKNLAAQKNKAIAVEMEAAAIAAIAAQNHIPFACVKVVLDEVSDELPRTDLRSLAKRAECSLTVLFKNWL